MSGSSPMTSSTTTSSQKRFKQKHYMAFSLIGLGIFVLCASLTPTLKGQPNRKLAAVSKVKGFLPERAPRQMFRTQKLLSTLNVQLSASAKSSSDNIEVQMTLSSPEPVSQLEYKWILPEGVQLVDDSDAPSSIAAGKASGHSLVLSSNNHEINYQVHLHVTGQTASGNKVTQVVQFNTRDQEDIESARSKLQFLNQQALEQITGSSKITF